MKNLFLILCLCAGMSAIGQTYNPSLSTATNKALGIAQAAPTDARSYFYDATNFVYRPYQNTNEVLSYLNLAKYRTGHFDIIVNTGGTLSNGVITGGTNAVWYFKNGTANGDLVLKSTVYSVNGQIGVVVSKNADSLKGQPFDTTGLRRNNYVVVYDSVNNKYKLAAQSGTSYNAGTGIDITSTVISAQTTTALWNANQLRGRAISTTTPTSGYVLKYDGVQWSPAVDEAALDTAYFSNDTLYLVADEDTSAVKLNLVPVGDNWGTQTAKTLHPILGAAIDGDEIRADTTRSDPTALVPNYRHDSLVQAVAALGPSGDGLNVKNADASGDTLSYVDADTAFIKRLIAGTNVTFTVGAGTITINGSSGTEEINTYAVSFSGTDTRSVEADRIVEYILVKPTADLTAFKVGTSTDDDIFITSTPVRAAADFQMLIAPFHLATTTTIYFSGITSTTDIKIVFKPMHE